MIEIGTAPLGDRFIDAVRAALRDPDLALWSFSRADDGYVDAQGRPQVLPPRDDPREATALIRDGVLVGAVVYDRAVADQPRLLAAVRAATTLALDNQRRQGELRGAVRGGPQGPRADRRVPGVPNSPVLESWALSQVQQLMSPHLPVGIARPRRPSHG